MADHGHAEYATAEGNDLPAHEAMYDRFVHLVVVGGAHVASIVIGLAIGAVAGHWFIAFALMIVASIVAIHGFITGVTATEHGHGGDFAARTRARLRRLKQGCQRVAGHEEAGECALP